MKTQYKIVNPIILALVGVSGSGKSTLEQNLVKDYPELFYKLQQFSTRSMRPGETFGNPYIFVQRKTFPLLQDRLIGVIGTKPDSLFKDMYGSLPDFTDGKIATIILAEEGIEDLRSKCGPGNLYADYNVIVIGLDVRYEELSEEDRAVRGRDDEFIAKERKVLEHADSIFMNGNGKYVNPRELVQLLVEDYGCIEAVPAE